MAIKGPHNEQGRTSMSPTWGTKYIVMEAKSEIYIREITRMITNIICGVPTNMQDGIQTSLLCKGTNTWSHSADVETKVQRGQATHSHSIQRTKLL